jgi:DNA-binding transcriptional LysR family regulator
MNAELSWNEFRLVKAIADSRSLAVAAELPGLNHSTVFRRLAALERSIGARLFERSRSGYRTIAAGDEMVALNADLEAVEG